MYTPLLQPQQFNGQSSRNVSRVLPIINVDSGLTFNAGPGSSVGNTCKRLNRACFTTTFRPIPKTTPNFDSSKNSFTYSQLFRRLCIQATTASIRPTVRRWPHSRILDPNTGAELFRAGIGQSLFQKTNVLPDGNVSNYPRNQSDWVAFAQAT